jgi:hypothetical protein
MEKEQLIAMAVPEARRLIAKLLDQRHPNTEHIISWSRFRGEPAGLIRSDNGKTAPLLVTA